MSSLCRVFPFNLAYVCCHHHHEAPVFAQHRKTTIPAVASGADDHRRQAHRKRQAARQLDKVPEGVDAEKVLSYLAALPGVTEVHDLHIWGLSTTETALTAHLVRPRAGTDDALLQRACEELRERFGIGHATFQIEDGDTENSCSLAPAHVI